MNDFKQFFRSKAGILVNKKMAHSLGMSTAIIYCELVSRYFYFKDNNKLDDEGWFYNTIQDLFEGTTFKKDTQNKAIKQLQELGLLEYEMRIVPLIGSLRYFRIVEDISLFCDITGEENPNKLESDSTICNLDGTCDSLDGTCDFSEGTVENIEPNNIKNNTNNNIKNKSKDFYSRSDSPTLQKTLISVPSKITKGEPKTQREKALVKIEQAKHGIIEWDKVTFRDFTFYFIEEHNKRLEESIDFDRYTSVTIIRDNLLKKYHVNPEDACKFIDDLLSCYLIHPKRQGKLTFGMIKNYYSLVDSLVEEVRAGRTELKPIGNVPIITQELIDKYKDVVVF